MKALSTLLFNTVLVHTRMDKMSAEGQAPTITITITILTLLYQQACAILEQSYDNKNKLPPECYAKQAFDPLKCILELFQ